MFVRKLKNCTQIVAGDHTLLRELFNPLKDSLDLRYSLAYARVLPGKTTGLHRLKTSEVYYILSGKGEMEIDGETKLVEEGDAIYIPPLAKQRIRNNEQQELIFICIVDPAWKKEDEEILGDQSRSPEFKKTPKNK